MLAQRIQGAAKQRKVSPDGKSSYSLRFVADKLRFDF